MGEAWTFGGWPCRHRGEIRNPRQHRDRTLQRISVRRCRHNHRSISTRLRATAAKWSAIPHGRDQLDLWPAFTAEQNAELPAEMLVEVNSGDDFGWPYRYYDRIARGYCLAPEYGGDGKTVGRCESIEAPIYAFPAHWAPNGVLFYTGTLFPAHYRNGIFVVFHGSWNRAPLPQAGFNIAFLPMRDGHVLAEHGQGRNPIGSFPPTATRRC